MPLYIYLPLYTLVSEEYWFKWLCTYGNLYDWQWNCLVFHIFQNDIIALLWFKINLLGGKLRCHHFILHFPGYWWCWVIFISCFYSLFFELAVSFVHFSTELQMLLLFICNSAFTIGDYYLLFVANIFFQSLICLSIDSDVFHT